MIATIDTKALKSVKVDSKTLYQGEKINVIIVKLNNNIYVYGNRVKLVRNKKRYKSHMNYALVYFNNYEIALIPFKSIKQIVIVEKGEYHQ